MNRFFVICALAVVGALAAGLAAAHGPGHHAKGEDAGGAPAKGEASKGGPPKGDGAASQPGDKGGTAPCAGCADKPRFALAHVSPTVGSQARGTVRAAEADDGTVTVSADFEGLTPNQAHGFHIHEFGDCSAADASSAGGHYNPAGHDHGLPGRDLRHAGDLGNLKADAAGKATLRLSAAGISIARKFGIVGRSIIVHARPDDGTAPAGNSGARIACGVLGVAKP